MIFLDLWNIMERKFPRIFLLIFLVELIHFRVRIMFLLLLANMKGKKGS